MRKNKGTETRLEGMHAQVQGMRHWAVNSRVKVRVNIVTHYISSSLLHELLFKSSSLSNMLVCCATPFN